MNKPKPYYLDHSIALNWIEAFHQEFAKDLLLMSVLNELGFQESQNKDLSHSSQIRMISGLSPWLPEVDNFKKEILTQSQKNC